MGMNDTFDFEIIAIEGSDEQENALFNPPKRLLSNQNDLENEWNACVKQLDGNNSIIEHLHRFSCQDAQTTIGQPTCILEYVKCLIFLTTYLQKIP